MTTDDDGPEITEAAIVPDSHGKWLQGVLGAALIGGLAWFATSDRASVERRQTSQESAITDIAGLTKVHEYRLNEQQERLERMEAKLDVIIDRLPARVGQR